MSLVSADFEVVRCLPEGGFARTYVMKNKDVPSKLHVFKVPKEGCEDMLASEARIHSIVGMRHPNVAEVYGVVTVSIGGAGAKALDMEYVPGENLKDCLRGHRPLEALAAVGYAVQIAEGLVFLNGFGISHRDLKPDNIMITEDGTAKIIDLGLATCAQWTAQLRLNRKYTAPEFHVGIEHADSDVWSFGLILYEMLSGLYLFGTGEDDGHSSAEEFKKYVVRKATGWAEMQAELDAEYLDAITRRTPATLRALLISCLKVDPAQRCSVHDLVPGLLAAKTAIRKEGMEAAKRDYTLRSELIGTAVKTYKDPVLRAKSRKLFEPIARDALALDIGCGQGDASTCLQEEVLGEGGPTWRPLVARIYYLDITPAMIQQGMKQGIIHPDSPITSQSAHERLPYDNNTFAYVITRYFLHDLTPEEKTALFSNVYGVLTKGGRFQVIDMVAQDEHTQRVYNTYHSRKTRGEVRQCWIPTMDEYRKLFASQGFVDIRLDHYLSHVNTGQWLQEKQITRERLQELNDFLRLEASKAKPVRDYFDVRDSADGNVDVSFPVVLACGTKA